MSSYVRKKTPGDTDWFVADRFGMFIHWGLYAMPARHEWVKSRELISEEKYDKYFKYFDPDLYDPKDWARRAAAAGMKYAVITAKHHEGFCMFDSKYTDYKCTNTPARRDLVREFVDAFRAEGIRIGFYYSLIDWHHPDFTVDILHPRRKDENAEALNEGRDMKKYAKYMRDQITELMTNYGKIDILWFDFSYTEKLNPAYKNIGNLRGKDELDWEAEELIKTARAINPDVIIDNRANIDQDLWTPEQYQPDVWVKDKKTGELVTWEACQTFSGSWGYYRDEMSWKSPKMLIELLVNSVSAGGNLLMNVGPTARGYLDDRAVTALGVFEHWMKYNSRSIYNCTMAEPEFKAPRGCRLTQSNDGKRLYIHICDYPCNFLVMRDMAGKVDYAQFLHDGSEIIIHEGECRECGTDYSDQLVLQLPPVKPDFEVVVIELFLK
ncbi:MAG: alpha-L-fucosidase [Clostridia bacterium]|nr:alpha-L-fucosidase [Clostridia bacterium]